MVADEEGKKETPMLYVLAAVRSRLALDMSAQLLGLIPQVRSAVGLQRRQGALQLLPALHRHTIPLFTLCSHQRKHKDIISQSIKSLFQHMSNKCSHILKNQNMKSLKHAYVHTIYNYLTTAIQKHSFL